MATSENFKYPIMNGLIRKINLILCLIGLSLIMQCKKSNNNSLPPETQIGNSTFGCLVNGQVFTPKGNGGLSVVLDCFYQQIYPGTNGFAFYVKGTNINTPLTSIGVGFDSLSLIEGKKYTLIELAKGNAYGSYRYAPTATSNIQNYNTSAVNTGELFISKLDEIKQIVAGTFWFSIVKSNGDTIRITQGRFDMKYTK